jgi:hypothetical protein
VLRARQTELDHTVADLRLAQKNLAVLRGKLQATGVVQTFQQPVLLIGPRAVGKTSLWKQWHSPWDVNPVEATRAPAEYVVPVYDHLPLQKVEHPWVDDVLVSVRKHLVLRVHDFPGELSYQKAILRKIREETATLQQRTRMTLGVVIVCMFDATEAVTGVSRDTDRYYNGDLFAGLNEARIEGSARVQRLVVLYNKFDLLRQQRPQTPVQELMQLCRSVFRDGGAGRNMEKVVNPEKVIDLPTILDRDSMLQNNQGAAIVKGVVARDFVAAIAGSAVASSLVPVDTLELPIDLAK